MGKPGPKFGHIVTEETRAKLRAANLGKKNKNYPKNRKKKSKEDCLKISIALSGRTLSDEHKRKISQSEKGKVVSEETKLKISKSTRDGMKREEVREKCRKGAIKALKSGFHNTSIERKVEDELKKYNIKFVKQKPICKGHFVLDFYLPEYQLAVECNGSYWHSLPNKIARDKELEKYVLSKGKDILWLWDYEINDEWFDISDYLEVNG